MTYNDERVSKRSSLMTLRIAENVNYYYPRCRRIKRARARARNVDHAIFFANVGISRTFIVFAYLNTRTHNERAAKKRNVKQRTNNTTQCSRIIVAIASTYFKRYAATVGGMKKKTYLCWADVKTRIKKFRIVKESRGVDRNKRRFKLSNLENLFSKIAAKTSFYGFEKNFFGSTVVKLKGSYRKSCPIYLPLQ